jgi:3-hydroxybutyryl-CoA dehydratase
VSGARVGQLAERPHPVRFTKTVSEADIYAFAGVSGDFAPIHVDEEYARASQAGGRVAHGVLVMAFMSAAATAWCAREGARTYSYGYDRVRFVRPVRIGDTVTVTYAKEAELPEKRQVIASVEAHNQSGELVAAARHILWVMP